MRLNILSYNIHKGLSAHNVRVVMHELRAMLRDVHADIVLLQEVVGERRHWQKRYANWPDHAQFEYLADSVWPHFAYGRNAIYDGGDHGNAILSKFPLQSDENIDLSLTRWERRGVLHATTRVSGLAAPLHLMTCHLNLFAHHRRTQLGQLCTRVKDSVPDDCPLLLGGDFNDWRRNADHMVTRAINGVEAYSATHRGRNARTYPARHPLLALDRIYVRGLQVRSAQVLDTPAWRGLSDHLALLACVELPAGALQ